MFSLVIKQRLLCLFNSDFFFFCIITGVLKGILFYQYILKRVIVSKTEAIQHEYARIRYLYFSSSHKIICVTVETGFKHILQPLLQHLK